VPGSTPRYTPEFRAEAVRLVRSAPDKPASQIARELGVSDNALRTWVKQSEIDQGEREGLTTGPRTRVRVISRKVRRFIAPGNAHLTSTELPSVAILGSWAHSYSPQ